MPAAFALPLNPALPFRLFAKPNGLGLNIARGVRKVLFVRKFADVYAAGSFGSPAPWK